MWSFSKENPLWTFVQEGIPKSLIVTTKDSKKDLDEFLRKESEEFVVESAKEVLGPVSQFLVRASAFILNEQSRSSINSQQVARPTLASQSFANPGSF